MGVGKSNIAATSAPANYQTVSKMETYVTFTGTGETDGGLSFGLSSTIATYSTAGGFADDGTSVFISGAFGKLTMGSVDEADKVAALSDIGGIKGLGVDDVAEGYVGAGGHEVNYTYSADAITASISGDVSGDNYAVGGKYTMGDYYAALGYNKAGNDKVTSVYAGGTFGAVKVAAMYSQDDNDESAGRCCTSPRFKDSLSESSGLDGWDEQAASPRLPYHELAHVQPRA